VNVALFKTYFMLPYFLGPVCFPRRIRRWDRVPGRRRRYTNSDYISFSPNVYI